MASKNNNESPVQISQSGSKVDLCKPWRAEQRDCVQFSLMGRIVTRGSILVRSYPATASVVVSAIIGCFSSLADGAVLIWLGSSNVGPICVRLRDRKNSSNLN